MVYEIELEQLKTEHARLHVAVEKMVADDDSDDVRIAVMKKRKLWIKDKIIELESKMQIAEAN